MTERELVEFSVAGAQASIAGLEVRLARRPGGTYYDSDRRRDLRRLILCNEDLARLQAQLAVMDAEARRGAA